MNCKYLLLSLLLFPLYGCVPDSEIPLPIFSLPSGSGGYSAPARAPSMPAGEPIAPPVYLSEFDSSKKQEQHGSVNADGCYQMEARFKKEGRKVKLVQVTSNPLNQGGGVLEFMCVFQGEDAVTDGSTFEDYRYNSRDEYQYP